MGLSRLPIADCRLPLCLTKREACNVEALKVTLEIESQSAIANCQSAILIWLNTKKDLF